MNSDVHADIANYTIYATNNHVEISCSALVSQNSNINVRRWDCTIGNDIIFSETRLVRIEGREMHCVGFYPDISVCMGLQK